MHKITLSTADRLRKLMETRGWDHNETAAAFSVDRASVYNWLSGKPMSKLAARVLGLLETETPDV